jgi:elongation factor G
LKEFGTESIRNISLIGHGSSGKTTFSEILLFTAGETNRIGNIAEGNTVSDYTTNEIEKQISISASLMHLAWNDTKINITGLPLGSGLTCTDSSLPARTASPSLAFGEGK